MTNLLIILAIALNVAIILLLMQNKKTDAGKTNTAAPTPQPAAAAAPTAAEQEPTPPTPDTKNFLLETLQHIGADVKDTDDERIIAEYQGYYFDFRYQSTSSIIHIIFARWYDVPQTDLELLSAMKQAANQTNMYSTVITFYMADDEEKTYNLHSRRDSVFERGLTDPDSYMRYLLADFFRARNLFYGEMEKAKVKNGVE